MSNLSRSYSIVFCSLLIGGLAVTVCFQTSRAKQSNEEENSNGKIRCVPYAQAGILEAIISIGSLDAPLFLLKHLREIQQKYNGLSCYRFFIPFMPGFCLYVVGDIQTQREILMDQTTDKEPSAYAPVNQIAGVKESIFTSCNNSHWKLVRKTTAAAFSNKEIDRMKSIVKQHTERWFNDMKQNKMQWNPSTKMFEYIMDPGIEMCTLTFQIICESAFEYKNVTLHDYSEFAENLELALVEYHMKQFVNPLRRYFKFVLPEVQAAAIASKCVLDFGYKILHSYRSNPNKSQANTLIKLIDSIDDISDRQKAAEIIVFLVAGHDTTGYTIASTLTLLAKHSTVFQKLKDDTRNLVPEQWPKSSNYFTSTLKETFRYVPVAALSAVRRTHKDFYVSTSRDHDTTTYKIPKFSTVVLPQCLSHRNVNMFGTSGDTYDPDRWLNINNITNNDSNTTAKASSMASTTSVHESSPTSSLSIIPFAMGLRNCAGKSFAMTELESTLPYILSYLDDMKIVKEGKLEFFLTWKYVDTQICIAMKEENISA